MDSIIQALASLFLVTHPVHTSCPIRPDYFALLVLAALLLTGMGLFIMGARYLGLQRKIAVWPAMIIVLMLGSRIYTRSAWHGYWWENVCAFTGILSRFIAGLGVAFGFLHLIGLRPRRGDGPGFELFHPMVVVATVGYAFYMLPELRWQFGMRDPQFAIAFYLVAVWLCFAGILTFIRRYTAPGADERAVLLVAAGVLLLLMLSLIHQPFAQSHQGLISIAFPVGVFVGACFAFTRIGAPNEHRYLAQRH